MYSNSPVSPVSHDCSEQPQRINWQHWLRFRGAPPSPEEAPLILEEEPTDLFSEENMCFLFFLFPFKKNKVIWFVKSQFALNRK